MTRTLRERLARHDAPPAVGTLVRCVNPESPYFDMTAKVVQPFSARGTAYVQFTSTNAIKELPATWLAVVERGE